MITLRTTTGLALAWAATALVAGTAQAQQQPAPAAQASAAAAEPLEPAALAALDRMGATLRAMQRFSVVSDGAIESVYANGQKIENFARTTYLVELPGRMQVDLRSDRNHSRMFYDGATMTLVGLGTRKYVSFPVTGTVGEVFDRAEDDFGITLPLRELFLWGSDRSDAERPRAGFLVGESTIDGTVVEHYAFRQSEMDWQIWLEKGARPLPRRIVITRTDVANQPRYSANFTWNTAPTFAADSFTWKPGPDFKMIETGTAARPATKRRK